MNNLDDSFEDFQKPILVKRRKQTYLKEEVLKYVGNNEDTKVETLCSLCKLPWTNNGSHTTVNLKCGHVFGEYCIKKHVNQSIAKSNVAKCPVCSEIVTRSNFKRIWRITVQNCDENELRNFRRENEEANMFLQPLAEERRLLRREIQQLKEELNKYMPEEKLKKKMSF